MSRWWQNNSSPSMGFVYFKPKEHSNSNGSMSSQSMGDTSDFLSFDNGTPPNCSPQDNRVFQDFNPQNYSSPRKQYYRKSPGFANGKRYSPVSGHNQSWRKNGGLTRNNSSQDSGHSHNYNRNRNRQSVNGNMSVFFDPTCIEDPWLELEQALIEKQRSQSSPEAENSTKSKSSTSNSEESDMENGSSEDSDLEKNA